MTEAVLPLIISGAAVLIVAILCGAALSAWKSWLAFRQAQLRTGPAEAAPRHDEEEQTSPAVLIEMAAVKERLRRLEAIAAGVEL